MGSILSRGHRGNGAPAAKPTLYERVGASLGIAPQDAMDAACAEFAKRLFSDPTLNRFFGTMNQDLHAKHLSGFVSMAFGSPSAYEFSKSEGGVTDLTKAHKGLGITDADFGAVAGHLQGTLEAVGLPNDLIAESMAIVGSTKDAVMAETMIVKQMTS